MAGRVCVVGSFMMDLVAHAPRRPEPGETLVGTAFAQHLGGKGMNQAVAAARAGAQVSMIGALGIDPFGDQFAAALEADGIDASHVSRDARLGTGVGLPIVDPTGENSIVIVPRVNLEVGPDHIAAAADTIAAADVLLVQQELGIDSAAEAARIARRSGTLVVLNPAPVVAGAEKLRGLVDLLVPNQIEAAALTGRSPDAPPLDLAGTLVHDWELKGLVVTLGGAGSLVVDAEQAWQVSTPQVTPVDTVGAGDAFCGNLAAELALGTPLQLAACFASAAAAISVTRNGAVDAMPSREDVVALAGGPTGPEACPYS